MSYKTPQEYPYPCPLCGAPNQVSEKDGDSFDICEICGWEDDNYQIRHPDETGANNLTFSEARKLWAEGKTLFPNHPNPRAKD